MSTYQDIKTDADNISEGAMRYFELQGERLKLELIERIAVSLTELIYALMIGIFVFTGLFVVCVVLVFVVQEFANNWLISAGCASALFAGMAWMAIRKGHTLIRDVITKVLIRSIYGREEK